MRPPGPRDTRDALLQAARLTVQARGYNALSFRELAKEVGIKSASVHHYFPTKGDLGATLASQYTDAGSEALERIFTETSNVTERLDRYTTIFRNALANDNRMCLVGILAAEHHDLPAEVRAEVARFTEANIAWLRRVLGAARPRRAAAEIDGWALALFAAVEGAQLIARGCGDLKAYDRAIGAYRTAGLLP